MISFFCVYQFCQQILSLLKNLFEREYTHNFFQFYDLDQ